MTVLPQNLPFVTCDQCAKLMKLVRISPRFRELSKLHVFICPSCGDIETKESLGVAVSHLPALSPSP
ncbi:MAG TPA: hypothetical protein VIY51_08140 [Xanthobacteraceae bacterium]